MFTFSRGMGLLPLPVYFRAVESIHSEIPVISSLGLYPKFEIGDHKMNYDMKRSGAYIRNLRIQNGYTQGELAKAMNMDRSFLSRIEAGRKGCSVDLFVQFSDFFHVSLDVLILGEEPDKALKNKSKALKADIAGLIDRLTQLQEQL